jgi:hypothetical protein
VRDGELGDALGAAWQELFALDPVIAASAAFDLLAAEPRIKPSRGLLVDPHDLVRRRWDRRVASASALLASPLAAQVFDELRDELAEDADLIADVLALAAPSPALSDGQRHALLALTARP